MNFLRFIECLRTERLGYFLPNRIILSTRFPPVTLRLFEKTSVLNSTSIRAKLNREMLAAKPADTQGSMSKVASQPSGEQFALQWHCLRKSIEGECRVDLTRYGYIETLLHSVLIRERDDATQVARRIRIEALPQSKPAAEQLPPHYVDSQAGKYGHVEAQFNGQIGGT